jgi:hypothetical protein
MQIQKFKFENLARILHKILENIPKNIPLWGHYKVKLG